VSPAKCDHCGREILVYACPECVKKLRASTKTTQKRVYRCMPCRFGTLDPETHKLRIPYQRCLECARARGAILEVKG